MDTKSFFKTLFEPLGIAPRLFLVDYVDKDGNCYNTESVLVGKADDDFIIHGIKKDYADKGYTVYGIIEVLHGYTGDQVEAMMRKNRDEGLRHLRPVFLDMKKHQETSVRRTQH